MTTGTSRLLTAFMSREPRPGMVKMVSVTMAPPMQPAKLMPTWVMTGTRLLRRAWRLSTRAREAPLERAVRM